MTKLLLAAALCAAAVSAQSYDTYGHGCLGGGGVPALHAFGLPVIGTRMALDVTRAQPGNVGYLTFAAARLPTPVDLAFVGAAGCLVYSLPLFGVFSPIDASGAAVVGFDIPNDPGLIAAAVHNQWVDFGVGGLATSNGGVGVFAAPETPMSGPSVSGPTSGGVGTRIQVRIRNLGRNNPDDLCMRVMDPATGDLSLLRVLSIVRDNSTGEDVLTAELMTAPGQRPTMGGEIGMMRGAGEQPTIGDQPCLTAPAAAWNWNGTGLPGNAIMTGSNFVPTPSGSTLTQSFVYDAGSNSLYVDLPLYPFGNGGLYPAGSGVTTDAHGDTRCGPGQPTSHFDDFLRRVEVKPACNLTRQDVAIQHAPQIQSAFDQRLGPGVLTVTAETSATQARIRIRPTNPACVLLGGGGSVVIAP